MANQPVDPLEPQGLPIDPREAAMLLLGMTAGELKSIDEKVISGRSSVGGLRSDIQKIVTDIRGMVPNQQPQPQPVPPPVHHVPPPLQVAQPGVQPPIAQQITPNEQDNQLEFDFYKKIKPEDLEYQLRLLKSSIDSLSSKMDLVLDIIKKKDQIAVNGNISQ